VPFGIIIVAAAVGIMPSVLRRPGTRLDIPGAIVLFAGLSSRHSCGSSDQLHAVAACR
jgi:hypothetical protein